MNYLPFVIQISVDPLVTEQNSKNPREQSDLKMSSFMLTRIFTSVVAYENFASAKSGGNLAGTVDWKEF